MFKKELSSFLNAFKLIHKGIYFCGKLYENLVVFSAITKGLLFKWNKYSKDCI